MKGRANKLFVDSNIREGDGEVVGGRAEGNGSLGATLPQSVGVES